MGKSQEKVNPERQRQRFSKDFKLAAVAMLRQGQKPAAQIAMELGIARNQLYKWANELEAKGEDAKAAFNGPGRKAVEERGEVERLKAQLAQVTEERDILKKAAAYFAKQLT